MMSLKDHAAQSEKMKLEEERWGFVTITQTVNTALLVVILIALLAR